LYAVYPPYVDLDRIEAAVRGEEEGLRAQLDTMRADREEARQEWHDLRQRGTLWLVVAYLTQQWLDALRRGHMWGSVFFTPREDLLVVTRPQRLLILTATCLTSMAVNAAFFGSNADRVSARFVAAAISAASMIPVKRLSPLLFAYINTFRASSIDVSYAVRQQRAKHLAERKWRALETMRESADYHGGDELEGSHRPGLDQEQPTDGRRLAGVSTSATPGGPV